ncbi:helix-turn-helix transcriptional regulator [Paratractidigestivibacter sp.]|uniref:helix-turn-helix domain-containing protein n=1 Tax=Paratractidigestivibacter sp. TaxID=2847316 RepID=UPI002ABD15E2|nr:helix-turn-helix transcriptional regulator [Paratractidigestivibacter sp.]
MSEPTIDAATIYDAMNRRGDTQVQAAAAMGIPPSTLSRVMCSGAAKLGTACRIADYCECGLDDLVRWPR